MSQARWEDKSTQARAVAEHGEPLGAAEASVPVISSTTAASNPMPTVLAVRRIGGTSGRFMSNSPADSGGVPDRRPVSLSTPGTRFGDGRAGFLVATRSRCGVTRFCVGYGVGPGLTARAQARRRFSVRGNVPKPRAGLMRHAHNGTPCSRPPAGGGAPIPRPDVSQGIPHRHMFDLGACPTLLPLTAKAY